MGAPVRAASKVFALSPIAALTALNDGSTIPLYVEIAVVTNAVLASCNVLEPADAVGA